MDAPEPNLPTPDPCPFCGGTGGLFQTSVMSHKDQAVNLKDLTEGVHPENIEYAFECLKCGANGPLAPSKPEAVDVWNWRVKKE